MQAKILHSEHFDSSKDLHYSFGRFVLLPLGAKKTEVIADDRLVAATVLTDTQYDSLNSELNAVHTVSGLSTVIAFASGNGLATLLLSGLSLFARSKRRVPLVLLFDDDRWVVIESSVKFAQTMLKKAPY